MTSFRFVHAADLHLDTPFHGIGRLAPDVAAALRDASLDAFDGLVNLCLEREAAFLLLAGDVYDGAERGIRAQLRVRDGLARLAAAGIRTFIIHGNHDPLNGWSAIREWPAGVHVFGSGEVESVAVEKGGRLLATIHGVSYGEREVRENLALRYARSEAPGIHIGLLHASVGDSREHAPYAPCSLADLAAARMDYWALGHIHLRSVTRHAGSWVVYPGSLQGRSTKSSERGAKGACVVEVVAGEVKAPEFVPLDHWRFEQVTVDVAAHPDLPALRTALEEAAAAAQWAAEGRGLLLEAVLEGEGPVTPDLRRAGVAEALLEELRRARPPLLWWTRLTDRTRNMYDPEATRERNDFIGAVARQGDHLRTQPAELAALIEETVRSGGRLGMEAPTPEEWEALLAEAERLAVLTLLDEGGA